MLSRACLNVNLTQHADATIIAVQKPGVASWIHAYSAASCSLYSTFNEHVPTRSPVRDARLSGMCLVNSAFSLACSPVVVACLCASRETRRCFPRATIPHQAHVVCSSDKSLCQSPCSARLICILVVACYMLYVIGCGGWTGYV